MKRGAPMKRTPFGRKAAEKTALPERTRPVYAPLARQVRYADPANDPVFAAPKREYVRSPALLAACRELPCMHCGKAEAGTVCAAHSNWSDLGGKGGHIQASDEYVAAMCDLCHVPILDQGSKLLRSERRAMWLAAHVKTVAELLRRGLWPAGVPIPDTTSSNHPEG